MSLTVGGRWIVCCSAAPERQRMPTETSRPSGSQVIVTSAISARSSRLRSFSEVRLAAHSAGRSCASASICSREGSRCGHDVLGELGLGVALARGASVSQRSRGCGRPGGSRARRRETRARPGWRHSGRARLVARARGLSARDGLEPRRRRRAQARSPRARAPASSRRATSSSTPAALTERQPGVWMWLMRETEQS